MGTSEFVLESGRRLAVHTVAEGVTDRTVVLCHAAPGSGGFDPDPEATWARGVTLIGVDRPGYGGSEPVRGGWGSVDLAADDLAELLDSMGTGPVGVAGWSAGGRVALALAARRPDLVDRVVVVATPAPDEEVPWIPPEQRAGLEALRGLPPDEVHEALGGQLAPLLSAGPEATVGMLAAGEADEATLARPGVRDRLTAMLAGAFAQGAAGIAADIAGYCLRPWGFEPAEVRAKTLLLYGAKDPAIGPRHGGWYQQRLPDSRYEQSPTSGHLVVVPTWQRALSHLAPHRKR